jgi:polysaccharide biosynthesis/export protein
MMSMKTVSLGVVACAFAFAACASTATNGDYKAAPAAASRQLCLSSSPNIADVGSDQSHYIVQPGDQLTISFYLSPEFDQKEITVRPDGNISLRLVGDMPAAGRTPDELASMLDKAYSSELRFPEASVLVTSMPGRVIYVAGQVTKPGEFPMHPGMTATQAISAAGGLTPEAGPSNVIVARRDACGNLDETPINLKALDRGRPGSDDMALLPADVVYVPRSGIANADLTIKQYVRDLLPIEPYLSLSPIP